MYLMAKRSKKYYYEDFLRVYPDGLIYDDNGKQRAADKDDINNFLNHRKFYYFASQFVQAKRVADIGCGSGYGCEIIKQHGAEYVSGSDISSHSIEFAKAKYGNIADFFIQNITKMNAYPQDAFDVTICSEVLEHVKEYGVEEKALQELMRITKSGGLIIIGTPNNEMFRSHGFSFQEIDPLLKKHFNNYVIFENALAPMNGKKDQWEKRKQAKETGVIISEKIDLSQTVLPDGVTPEIKKGLEPGSYKFLQYDIDTSLLHNTHSWNIIAENTK
jgi:2-polyprenyl-3-methyl-5-hydroxy-6-metoxy-1,4-benzoquinol methylase